jgi:hypothetical protein
MDIQYVYSKKIKSPYGTIYIATIEDILDDIGEDLYNEILLAFSINLDLFKLDSESKSQMRNFDLYFVIGEPVGTSGLTYLELMLKGISIFFKTENIKINQDELSILINDETVINRDNFDDLTDCILKSHAREYVKPEEEPEFKNEDDRITWLKIQKAKKKRESKDSITLKDMLDVVLHSKTTSYTYESIVKLTYSQIINSYKIVMNIENFDFMTCFLGMGVDTKDMDLTHWSEKIRKH